GRRGERLEDQAPPGTLEIDRDRALAAVPAEEPGELAERVALERLDLDDRGPDVGKLHRRVRAGDVAGQIDDENSVERRRGRGHGLGRLPRDVPDDLLAMVIDVTVHRLERLGALEVDVQVVLPGEADA